MVVAEVIQFSFNVLFRASIYVLVAIGLSIIFGSLQYVNMAHGALYLFGAYLGYVIAGTNQYSDGILAGMGQFGLDAGFVAALVVVPIVVFLAGVVMEHFLAKPFYDRPLLDQLLVTFGILLVFQEVVGEIFGKSSLLYPRPDWLLGAFELPGIGVPPGFESVSTVRVIAVLLTLVLIGVIVAFYRYTNYGLAVRAGTEDTEMTRLLGIRVDRPFLLIFAIGAAYAGIGGLLGGFQFGFSYQSGVEIIIPALVIVIMGGVGSLRGTILASLLAGLSVAVVGVFVPSMSTASIYVLAIIVLAFRPNGLFESEAIAQ
ncbi:branched-chain amino acid ABC transporter permease [Halobellus rubicundus]|uniref:Branched-chain amino acid ABC transporter permease n=1 Tax=Halobellus rubicundus TaxID=2996466 RepID=A0ABD5MFM8_9EURY